MPEGLCCAISVPPAIDKGRCSRGSTGLFLIDGLESVFQVDPAGYEYLLTLCASCCSHLKDNYPKLSGDEPGMRVMPRQPARGVIDFSSFMVNVLGVKPEMFLGSGWKVAYHSPCHIAAGAELLVTDRPGCVPQLRCGMDKRGQGQSEAHCRSCCGGARKQRTKRRML